MPLITNNTFISYNIYKGNNLMACKESWKKTGKNTGKAFANLGKAIGTTAKVAVGNEDNHNGEGEKTKTGKAWTEVGHGFADAGKSLGKAFVDTFDTIVDDSPDNKDIKKKDAIDVEFEEKKNE